MLISRLWWTRSRLSSKKKPKCLDSESLEPFSSLFIDAASSIIIPDGRTLRDHVASVLTEDPRAFYPPEEFVEKNVNFFATALQYARPSSNSPDEFGLFDLAMETLGAIPESDWTSSLIKGKVRFFHEELVRRNKPPDNTDTAWPKKMKATVLGQLRHALVGGKPGPGVPITMELLGKHITLARLRDRKAGKGVWKGPEHEQSE